MVVTLRDVARESGVSVSVASRSFLDGSPVAAPTRARVLAAARRLGYRRNRLAAGLTTGRTRLVALVLDEAPDAAALRLTAAVGRGLQEQGLRPLLVHAGGPRDSREARRSLEEYSVEAAVILSATLPPGFVRPLAEGGLPVVQALARPAGPSEVGQVALADTVAGREAARLLLGRGYRALAFIGGPEATQPTRDRAAGFRAFAARGGEPRMAFAPAFGVEEGRETMRALLAGGPVDAAFCADDRLAMGALAALREAGLGVPDQVGLLGCGGHEAGAWAGFDLSTLAPPLDAMAEAAVAAVLAALADRAAPPEARRFEPVLIERGTLRPAAPSRMSAAAR